MGFLDSIFGRKKKNPPYSEMSKSQDKPVRAVAPPQNTEIATVVPRPQNGQRRKKNPSFDMKDYVSPLSSTQAEVLDYLRPFPKGITFVHGKAGCGKTYLIRQIESSRHATI